MATADTPSPGPLSRSGLTRRSFLQGIAGVLAAAPAVQLFGPDALAGATGLTGASWAAEAFGPSLPVGTPIVVLVELAGGNDILNTVVPFAVPTTTGHYRTARPGIGITRLVTARPYGPPPSGDYLPPALDLDGQWALHGALPFLANRWHTNGDVAIVKGTGENVVRDMSHFAAMAFRWAGAFGGNLMNTGWLGRYNDLANPHQALGAVSLAGTHQALASVDSPSVAISDLQNFNFTASDVPDRDRFFTEVSAFGEADSAAINKVGVASEALELARQAAATAGAVPRLGQAGGSSSLAGQMATAASLILGNVPCQTYVATLGAFDTHGSEPYNHWDRLTLLNAGLAHFFSLIDGSPRAADVFVVIQSEFGRQVIQNAGQGTDHGQASDAIILGGGVQGGLYGQAPSVAPAARDTDAMVATVDFRSVYATVLNRLGGDPNLTEAAQGPSESGQPFADLGVFAGAAPLAAVPSGAEAFGVDGATVPALRPAADAQVQPYLEAPLLEAAAPP
jgi:uncharacterized protein (DUF1501 family)